MPDVCCLLSAVHHLDSALLHPGGGHSPYRNSVACPEECKHSLSNRYYSCTAHFSTKIVPTDIKKARKRPFYRLLRAFENYSNSTSFGRFFVITYVKISFFSPSLHLFHTLHLFRKRLNVTIMSQLHSWDEGINSNRSPTLH